MKNTYFVILPSAIYFLISTFTVDLSAQENFHVEGNGYFTEKLGIGATPNHYSLFIKNFNSARALQLESSSTEGTWLDIYNSSDTSTEDMNRLWRIINTGTANNEGAGQLLFDQVNVAPRMIIRSDGKIGIGTSYPQAQLHVTGNTIIEGSISQVTDPVANQDVTTKNYVDNLLVAFGVSLGVPEAIQGLIDAGISLQKILDAGANPIYILSSGVDTSALIGLTYQGGTIFNVNPDGTGFVITPDH